MWTKWGAREVERVVKLSVVLKVGARMIIQPINYAYAWHAIDWPGLISKYQQCGFSSLPGWFLNSEPELCPDQF